MTDAEVIDAIGADTIIAELGVTAVAVKKWRQRGIPWRCRGLIERLAKVCKVKLPRDFDAVRAA